MVDPRTSPLTQEVVFQLLLHATVFWFWAVARGDGIARTHEFAFFSLYALTAGVMNYGLLPHLLYRGRYLTFFGALTVLLGALIFSEERLLEPYFFTGTRAKVFPGVVHTLAELLPIVSILVGGKFAYDALWQRRQMADLRLAVRESELNYLRAQINPHFLFNNLNNLYSLSIERSEKVPELILGLSDSLRYMLYESRGTWIALSREVDQLNDLIKLGQLQLGERGRIDLAATGPTQRFGIAPPAAQSLRRKCL